MEGSSEAVNAEFNAGNNDIIISEIEEDVTKVVNDKSNLPCPGDISVDVDISGLHKKNKREYVSSNERPIKEPKVVEEDPFDLEPVILGLDSNVVKVRGPKSIPVANSFEALMDMDEINSCTGEETEAGGKNEVIQKVKGVPVDEDQSDDSVDNSFEEEIDCTKSLGSKLGVQLEGFDDMVKLTVQGARVQSAIQETLVSSCNRYDFDNLWNGSGCDFDMVLLSGRSGGLVSMWDNSKFRKTKTVADKNFILTTGYLVEDGSVINLVNVYAPQKANEKRSLWSRLLELIQSGEGMWVFIGDFNVVRWVEEQKNSKFNKGMANDFNSFIEEASLHEYIMRGNRFTFLAGSGNEIKMSKIDRVLVVIQALENCNYTGKSDVIIQKKLGDARNALRRWWKEMCKKEEDQFTLIKDELAGLEKKLESTDLEEDEIWVWEENKKELEKLLYFKNRDLHQKSRVNWAVNGDENSRFFHCCIKGRRAANAIPGLMMDGVWVSKPPIVKREVLRFYTNLFKKEFNSRPGLLCDNLKQVLEDAITGLIAPFSREEVKAAAFDCGADKAPGPDGFNFRFIMHFWKYLEDDFMKLFEDFFHTGSISEECSTSFITLIAKTKTPVGLKDYRPINLIGIISKLISKVLAARMKEVIGKVISVSQSAFLKERYILDGPLILNEIIGWVKRNKKRAFFLKIDFEKAYDNKWCSWVKGVIGSAHSAVLVNGSPTFEFQCQKGLRQGDPLSPFLFLIVMEALDRMLSKAVGLGLLEGVNLADGGIVVSHMLYADDALILGNWSKENLENTSRLLRIFYLCSGLKINFHKSVIYGMGVEEAEVNRVSHLLGCKVGELPFLYLGIKVGANMNRVSNWDSVVESIRSRLNSWKARLLSMGGCFCGSGVRRLEGFIGWLGRFKSDNVSLWRGVIEGIHGGKGRWSFLPLKSGYTGCWKCIVRLLEGLVVDGKYFKYCFKGKVGKGDKISFWKDIWYGETPLMVRWPKIFAQEVHKNATVDQRIKLVEDKVVLADSWIFDSFTVELISEHQDVQAMVGNVQLSSFNDSWSWTQESNGAFSVAAVKRWLRTKRYEVPVQFMMWESWIPLKINIFIWRLELDRLPTREALFKRKLNIPDLSCPFCESVQESSIHIIVSCGFSFGVWSQIWSWCRIFGLGVDSVQDLLRMDYVYNKSKWEKKVLRGITMATCWLIWHERNKKIFQNSKPQVVEIVATVKALCFFWLKHRSRFKDIVWDDWVKYPLYML
ncbi:uncharacterized protein LOC110888390 [Helianthus annuus]|uniref:uncharacterized protein LOC110888390 n=1 Tax=Helianthus annuus TaxID=4232 RepID=UPI000B8FF7D2|nr:uncharacterized protein LOC110888390 [Helianthus annuus]